jgi:ankyrin repeat protein
MVELGADVAAQAAAGARPLDIAAHNGHVKVVRALVREGDYRCQQWST